MEPSFTANPLMRGRPSSSSSSSSSYPYPPQQQQQHQSLNVATTAARVAIVLSIAASWVTATHLAAAAQGPGGTSSFTLLVCSTSLLSLFLLHPAIRRSPPRRFTENVAVSVPTEEDADSHYHEVRTGGGDSYNWFEWRRGRLAVVAFFLALWLCCNLSYVFALTLAPASTVTAVFATAPAFVYLFSLALLREDHDALRLLAVAAAVLGVVLAAIGASATEGDNSGSGGGGDDDDEDDEDEGGGGKGGRAVLGCLLSLAAAVLAALYKVSFFRTFGNAPPAAVAHVLGCLGLLCLVVCGPVELALVLLAARGGGNDGEDAGSWGRLPSSSSMGLLLLAYALASAAFNFSVNFGVAATHPLFVSVGTVVGIPVSVAADCLLLYGPGSATCAVLTAALPVCGYFAIMLAFGVLLWRGHKKSSGSSGASASEREGEGPSHF